MKSSKHPSILGEVPHRYDDKYLLQEFLTNTAIASELLALEELGLDPQTIFTLASEQNASGIPTKLSFERRVTCEFKEEKEYEKQGPKHVVQVKTETTTTPTKDVDDEDESLLVTMDGEIKEDKTTEEKKKTKAETTVTSHMVTKITEYIWRIGAEFSIVLSTGTGAELKRRVLQTRVGEHFMKTTTDKAPRPNEVEEPPLMLDLKWLLEQLGHSRPGFKITRDHPDCHTPRYDPSLSPFNIILTTKRIPDEIQKSQLPSKAFQL